MDQGNEALKSLLDKVGILKKQAEDRTARRLDLGLLERCMQRIESFSEECEECKNFIPAFDHLLERLIDGLGTSDKSLLADYHVYMKKLTVHFQKKHKLVQEGYYMGIWMMLGMTLAIPMGTALNNVALGVPIGMCLGIAIGISLDANAKKKGQVI